MATNLLKKLQIGKEVTWGTAVAATAIVARVTDASLTYEHEDTVPEILGSLGPGIDALRVSESASLSITQLGTYEQLCYWLDGLFGTATPSGTADPYTYSYTGSTTTAPTPSFWTVEYGLPSNVYEMEGALLSSLGISIDGYNPWEVTAELMGQTITSSSYTGALSETSVNVIQGLTNVYIDAFAGTIGSTAVTGSVKSAEIQFETGRHLKYFTASPIASTWGEGRFGFSVDFTAEFDATWKAYFDAMITSPVSKIVRLKTTSSTRQAQMDFYGLLTINDLWGDADGNAVVDATLTARYDATNSKWFAAEFKHALSALP